MYILCYLYLRFVKLTLLKHDGGSPTAVGYSILPFGILKEQTGEQNVEVTLFECKGGRGALHLTVGFEKKVQEEKKQVKSEKSETKIRVVEKSSVPLVSTLARQRTIKQSIRRLFMGLKKRKNSALRGWMRGWIANWR